jgi:hypothetical protein
MQKLLQQEWQFVQCMVQNIGDDFLVVEKSIFDVFLLALFGNILDDDNPCCQLASLLVKCTILALLTCNRQEYIISD